MILNYYLNQVMAISLLIIVPLIQPTIQLTIQLIIPIILLINILKLIIILIHIIVLIHIITPQLINILIDIYYFQYYPLVIIQHIEVIHILLNFNEFLAFLPILNLDYVIPINFLNIKEVFNFKIMGVDQIMFLNLILLLLVNFSEIALTIQALIILLTLYQFL